MKIVATSVVMNIPGPGLPSLRRRNFELWGEFAIRGRTVVPGWNEETRSCPEGSIVQSREK